MITWWDLSKVCKTGSTFENQCMQSIISKDQKERSSWCGVVWWVKNPTAVAWVAVEVWVQSPFQHNGLKDPVLHILQLWLEFSPQPGNFCMPWVWSLKKKAEKEKAHDGINCCRKKCLIKETNTYLWLKTSQ